MPLSKALALMALAAALAFLLGANFSSPENRKQFAQLETLDKRVRDLADADVRRSRETADLRAQLAMRAAENERLENENRDLVSDVLRREEQLLFYRQIIDAKSADRDIIIHALAQEPGFEPGERKLSAVLIRSRRGKFKGAYHFEVVSELDGAEAVMRIPEQAGKLDFQQYLELSESVTLPDDARILKMRLVVTNAKKAVVASNEEVFSDGDDDSAAEPADTITEDGESESEEPGDEAAENDGDNE